MKQLKMPNFIRSSLESRSLIQRFGRIDRIGSEFEEIHGFNFLRVETR